MNDFLKTEETKVDDKKKDDKKDVSLIKDIMIIVIFGLGTFLCSLGIYKAAYAGSLIDGGVYDCQTPVSIMQFFELWFILWGFLTVIHILKNIIRRFIGK